MHSLLSIHFRNRFPNYIYLTTIKSVINLLSINHISVEFQYPLIVHISRSSLQTYASSKHLQCVLTQQVLALLHLSLCEFRKLKENPKKRDRLITFRLSCNGFRPLRVLLDSGASKNFVRRYILKENKDMYETVCKNSRRNDWLLIRLVAGRRTCCED